MKIVTCEYCLWAGNENESECPNCGHELKVHTEDESDVRMLSGDSMTTLLRCTYLFKRIVELNTCGNVGCAECANEHQILAQIAQALDPFEVMAKGEFEASLDLQSMGEVDRMVH
jgi:hypothetical protein